MEMNEIRHGKLTSNEKVMQAVKTMLQEIGENPDREGLQRTPLRVSKAMEEWYGGYSQNVKGIINRTFEPEKYRGIIIMKNIDFYSHCEHHMTPFFGKVHIGYIPEDYITGLDKLIKVVEVFSRRLQNQERLTDQIADCIQESLNPKGTIVVIEAQHFCIMSRETRNQSSSTTTSSVRGIFLQPIEGRTPKEEFMKLIGK